jgi:hypothetical protein
MWMLTSEEDDPARESLSRFLRHIGGSVALAFGVLLVVSLVEKRPLSGDRYPDCFVMALLAGVAGASAGAGRRLFSALRALSVSKGSPDPAARSLRKQYLVVYGFGALMFFFFAAILFLLAVSIGTGHGEWVSWMPHLARRRGLIDLLLR